MKIKIKTLLHACLPQHFYSLLQTFWHKVAWFRYFKQNAQKPFSQDLGMLWLWNGRSAIAAIAQMLDSEDNRKAEKALRWYLDNTDDTEGVELNPRIAAFAFNTGICHTSQLEHAAYVYENAKETHMCAKLAHLVDGKTVAIVGNGPYEIGKKLGEEIDAHDVVVRFNNFAEEKFAADYGVRTDIWSKATIDYIMHERVYRVKAMIVHDKNIERLSLKPGYVEAFYSAIQRGISIDYYSQDVRNALSSVGCPSPTTGLLMIETMRRTRAKCIDVYGFSFLEQGTSQETYCNLGQTITQDRMKYEVSFHNINFEIQYLRGLFKGGRRLIPQNHSESA